jgi:thiol:disulfide interchange protein DsbC
MTLATIRTLAAAALLALGFANLAHAQEAAIRKALADRVPQMGQVDEVTRTPMPGIWEVRVGADLYYTDSKGDFLIHGQLIDTKQQRNLTEERTEKLMAIEFSQLPLKDAFTIVRGNGKRKLAVFQDPNCPYCKRFERDMQKVDNVTIYMFLYPILGPDSTDKSRNLWCAKDRAGAWQDWMIRDKAAPNANCDTAAIARNLDFGRRHRITGTPTMLFADGTRVPGAIGAPQIEKYLSDKQ